MGEYIHGNKVGPVPAHQRPDRHQPHTTTTTTTTTPPHFVTHPFTYGTP